MGESFSKSILIKLGVAILAIALIDLFYLNYWVIKSEKLKVESGKFAQENRQIEPKPSQSPQAESPSPVVSEASLWTDGGNGQAWAKLKNVSDNNPFIESQISSTSGVGEVKTSGKIPIPAGSKKYGVQAKTDITNFAAHVDNARLKIVLR